MNGKKLEQAAAEKNQLIVLTELHSGLHFCQQEDANYYEWAEPIPGKTSQWLSKLAKSLGIIIVGSIFEKRQTGIQRNDLLFETGGFDTLG